QVPHLDDALQIGGDEMLAIGMESRVVDVAVVPGEVVHQFAVGDGPQLDEVVIAAGGQRSAIGADGQRADPTAMRFEGLHDRRLLRVYRPREYATSPVAGEEEFLLGRERQCAHPTLMPGLDGLLAALQVPANHAVVLGAGEYKLPGRIEPATDER